MNSEQAVIAFLVITTVINIALGYALAVYLGSASTALLTEGTVEPSREPRISIAMSGAPERTVAASLADAVSMAAGATIPQASAPEAAEPVAASQAAQKEGQSHYRPAEMEQDMLAGIEEFRNQLAQLKAQNFDEEAPTLAGLEQ